MLATSINEIRSLLQFSQQNRVPITFRAADTSLSGQSDDRYYSSNITCEMGMTLATQHNYHSIIYLLEQASRISSE